MSKIASLRKLAAHTNLCDNFIQLFVFLDLLTLFTEGDAIDNLFFSCQNDGKLFELNGFK